MKSAYRFSTNVFFMTAKRRALWAGAGTVILWAVLLWAIR